MEFQGSKGKWYKGVTGDVKQVGSKKVVADCCFFGDDKIIEQANAKLISCAPEMLEMLQWLLLSNTLSSYDISKIEELIKQATTI